MAEDESTEPEAGETGGEPAPRREAAGGSPEAGGTEGESRPAAEAPREAGPAAEEVPAEPFDKSRDEGPTVDMPPPGSKRTGAATGSAALAATAHLLGLADFTVSVLLIGILAPLVFWLVLKDTDPEIDYNGKESINFQINILFWWLISTVLSFCIIGIPMLIALMVVEIVLVIIAAVEAARGKRYRYPGIYRILQ